MVDVKVSLITDGCQRVDILAIGEEVEGVYDRAIAGVFKRDDAECCSGGLYGLEDVWVKPNTLKRSKHLII